MNPAASANGRCLLQTGTLTLLFDFLEPLRWMLLAALVLTLADLRFGIRAARRRGEPVRASRALRRTVNKLADYCCWIILAGVMGEAFGHPFGIPLLPALMLLVVFGCEVNSCYSNYFESRGERVRVNVFRFFARRADIIEPEQEDYTTQTD